MIGTHGSYAGAAGCSTGTTQTTFSTAIPEVTSTDQVNGLVVRVYPWETGTKTKVINVDLATVSGSTPYAAFTAYEIQSVDDTSGTPATTPWSLATVDATAYTAASELAVGRSGDDEVPQARPSSPSSRPAPSSPAPR